MRLCGVYSDDALYRLQEAYAHDLNSRAVNDFAQGFADAVCGRAVLCAGRPGKARKGYGSATYSPQIAEEVGGLRVMSSNCLGIVVYWTP
jgi:hypothetical protein